MVINKTNFKKSIEKEFIRKNISFQKDVRMNGKHIDYIIVSNGQENGVEVKVNYSNPHNAIGQILDMRNTFSHVFLIAPMPFLKKIQSMMNSIEPFKQIGLMTIEVGELKTIRAASNDVYYVKRVTNETPDRSRNCTRVTKNDIKILEKFKDTPFFIHTLVKEIGITTTVAYQRIKRLKGMGLLEAINDENPRLFRIKGIKKLGEEVDYTT